MKEQLLTSAREKAYFSLAPPELEQLWNVSNRFIDANRLICFEFEWFPLLEQHFFLSLLTCRDVVAKLMLKRIIDKFGTDSRRVTKLQAAYIRSTQDDPELARHVNELADIEFDARKIGMATIKGKPQFIAELVAYLDVNPIDAEAWAELGEAYAECSDYEAGVQCWQQVLVLEPVAFNAWARLGELKRLRAAAQTQQISQAKQLVKESLDCFCRSVELNPLYLRGWCGILVVSGFLADCDELNQKALTSVKRLAANSVGSVRDIAAANKILLFQ